VGDGLGRPERGSSAGFAGATPILGGGSEGAVEAPSDRLVEKLRSLSPANV